MLKKLRGCLKALPTASSVGEGLEVTHELVRLEWRSVFNAVLHALGLSMKALTMDECIKRVP